MTFELHRLLQECSWGIKQGLAIVTCKTEDLVMTVCMFLVVFLTALYFTVTYCTIRACASLIQVPYVPQCPWEGLGNIRHLHERGTSCEGAGNNLLCGVYYCKFLDFFSSMGRTLSESWTALHWGGCVPGVRT
jgi:hypothetical protein